MFKKKAFVVLLAAFGLIACDPAATSTTPPESTPPASTPTESEESGVTITYQVDGKTVHTEKLAETGGVPTNYAYTPSEGEFVGWYLTPTFSRIYDFKTALTEDTTLFGAVSIYEEDTRVFYLAGAGTSPVLSTSSWGDNPTDAHKLTKEANKNVFTITADFYANDQFQITSFKETETDPYAWDWQYGVGYIINASELTDIVEGAGGIAASNRKSNIKILQDGNYTVTLKTYPDHIDPEDTEHINNLDNITIKRNGDPVEEKPETTYAYYIKGKNITNWQSQLNATTRFADQQNGTYKLTIYLDAGEQFMFHTVATKADGSTSDANIYINYTNLDTAAQALFAKPENGNDILTKDAGEYTFIYTPGADNTAGTVTATVDKTKTLLVHDYYLNGTMASSDGLSWSPSTVHDNDILKDTYKFTVNSADARLYELKGVKMVANAEFAIAAFIAGSTTVGDGWSNKAADYNYTYSDTNNSAEVWEAANAVGGNYNFKCKVAGTYDISYNVYSHIITIKSAA